MLFTENAAPPPPFLVIVLPVGALKVPLTVVSEHAPPAVDVVVEDRLARCRSMAAVVIFTAGPLPR